MPCETCDPVLGELGLEWVDPEGGAVVSQPAELRFGAVEYGGLQRLLLIARNTGEGPLWLERMESTGADPVNIERSGPEEASFEAAFESGLQLDPGDRRAFDVLFRPPSGTAFVPGQTFEAALRLTAKRVPEERSRATARLFGQNDPTPGLVVTPEAPDCGPVPSGEMQVEVTFQNPGAREVTLHGLRTSLPRELVVRPEATGELPIPANASRKVRLDCWPMLPGLRRAELWFETDLPFMPRGSVPLTFFNGAPHVELSPRPQLDFGRVAFIAGAAPWSQHRRLTVRNTGLRSFGNPRGNLKLGQGGAAPYLKILPAPGTLATELGVTVPSSYDPAVGIGSSPGHDSLDLQVTWTPASVGPKRATVTLFTNDPLRPEVSVLVTAEAAVLPACALSVSPAAVDFGTVDLPAPVDRVVTFTNGGSTGDCLVANVELAAFAHPAFSLPDGEVEARFLAQGMSFPVRVRATPRGLSGPAPAEVTAALRFSAVAPSLPPPVPLRASLAAGCLTLSPPSVAFGEMMLGCASRVRTVEVRNTCQSEVGVSALRTCTPAAPCPEFTALASSLPPGGASLSPNTTFSFGVRYQPADAGADEGAMSLDVEEGGRTVTYLAPLSASAVERVARSESFTVPPPPAYDLLLVIDTSESMAADAPAVRLNLGSLAKYLALSGNEYRVAVTRTSGTALRGEFISGPGHPKVMVSGVAGFEATVNAAAAAATTAHGGAGSGEVLATAAAALSAPLLSTVNSGFLRPGATLVVLAISDSPDASPLPAADYVAALQASSQGQGLEVIVVSGFSSQGSCATLDDGRYQQLVNATNGLKLDICDLDWARAIGFGPICFGWPNSLFYLSGPPGNAASVEVEIDGTPIPALDSGGGTVWHYDPVLHAIEFEPMSAPEPRQVVTVRYLPRCE